MSCHVLSVVVGGLESSQTDFVPESDSDDDDVAARGADESLVKGLVEETQVYDDDDDDGGGGVHGNSTVLDDAASEQVITHFSQVVQLVWCPGKSWIFCKISRPWKVPEDGFVPGKSWKF